MDIDAVFRNVAQLELDEIAAQASQETRQALLRKWAKHVSDKYGGDNSQWLNEYCNELIKRNGSNLTAAIQALKEWLDY